MKRLLIAVSVFVVCFPSAMHAQGFSGWYTARTKHFVFVYQKQDQAAVDELRSFAEEVYGKVTTLFGSYPKRIWVVVDGHVDAANGAFVPAGLPPHIIIYVTSPSVPVLGSKEHQYLRLLLTHELTHYVHLDYNRGFFAVLSDVLGPGLKALDYLFLPDWMMEGIAVNDETMFTHGGRGRDPFFEMKYKALILDSRFFSLGQAAYGSAYPPSDRVYLGGYLLVHYLLEHFGMDTFTKIHERYVKFPFFGPWAAIKAVTGQSADQIFSGMEFELDKKYARYRAIPEGKLVSPKRIGDYYLPVVTRRGWYEYRSNLDSPPAIVRFDPKTRQERVLAYTSLSDYSSLTATADGNKIVFATFDITPGPAGIAATSDLYSLNPYTRTVHRITSSAHLWQPALSPGGDILVAVQRSGSYTRLVTVDQKTGAVHGLFSEPQTNVYNPTFSPDGRLLAFALNNRGTQRIMLLDVGRAIENARLSNSATGSLNVDLAHVLPASPATNAFFPRFTGDTHVVFSADLNKGLALYEAGLSGKTLYRIAEDPVGAWEGAVVGNRVLYASYSANGYVLREKELKKVAVPGGGAGDLAPTSVHTGRADSRATTDSAAGPGKIGRYIDWPRLLYWLPIPYYTYLPPASTSLKLGIGASAVATSLLGRNAVSGTLSFRTDIFQPALDLSVASMIGNSTLSYSLSEGYGAASSGYSQTIDQSLSVAVPLLSNSLMGVATSLSLTPGLTDSVAVNRSTQFSLAEPFQTPSSFSYTNAYSLDLGLAFSRSVAAAALDLYPPRDLELDLTGHYYPSYLSVATPGIDTVFQGTLSVPSFFRHQVIRLGLASSYSSIPGKRAPLVNPRGLFIPDLSSPTQLSEQTTAGRSVIALDYLFTIHLLDDPLIFGFNLQGLAAGVHVSAAADWAPSPAVFSPDHAVYAGVELLSLIGYQNGAILPIGVGVNFRLDPTFSRPFNPAYDIGPYIFIGTNSFLGTPTSVASALVATLHRPGIRWSR